MKLKKQLKEIWRVNKIDYFIALGVTFLGAFLITGGNNLQYALPFSFLFITTAMFGFGLFLDS